nr:immunoglobulin light chain junction region [Macaca mulatta]MOX19307.1 immunoglobulin light chain junction region [Macaca mulatta]MOX20913.1 immunoglobulin light chain junction region [Macaca mulatta]
DYYCNSHAGSNTYVF